MRETLAPALAAQGRGAQAAEIVDGIRNPPGRFLARLRILSPGEILQDSLAPRRLLYASMVSAQRPHRGMSRALGAGSRTRRDPGRSCCGRRWIAPIRSGELQTQALLRLARHALAFQRSFYRRRQDFGQLEVVRGSIAVETDEHLVLLTPEIAALGAEAGDREAVGELQEAARQLADLATVPWPTRRYAFEHLLASVTPVLRAQRQEPARGELRRSLAVLAAVARLPIGPRAIPALDELRSHWHEVLPILLAAADRLPQTGTTFQRALREGISACRTSGGAAAAIFALCLAPLAERLKAGGARPPIPSQALAYLLHRAGPNGFPRPRALGVRAAGPPDSPPRALRLGHAARGRRPAR